MSLHQPTMNNLKAILHYIQNRLQVMNSELFHTDHFSLDQYDELYEIYLLLQYKEQLSIAEVSALVDELGKLRTAK